MNAPMDESHRISNSDSESQGISVANIPVTPVVEYRNTNGYLACKVHGVYYELIQWKPARWSWLCLLDPGNVEVFWK